MTDVPDRKKLTVMTGHLFDCQNGSQCYVFGNAISEKETVSIPCRCAGYYRDSESGL